MNSVNFIFPELETDRLRLSVLTLDDAAAVFEHFSDENVTRFMDIEPCKIGQGNERSIGLLRKLDFEREIEPRDQFIYYCLNREGWR